ncbi:unnamed protein product [Strongylus vulgaris]|uniref:Uncharacterized protein n=1 Tax=Strongylus vulgaris TaxID=40348 RepID=A0A3P7LMD7_STRVU|nr:unnamed protein product [Strongylus vulgaris]
MPSLKAQQQPTDGLSNGSSMISSSRKTGQSHGAALQPSRPPQFLVHPQAVAAKAGETVTFTAKVSFTPSI